MLQTAVAITVSCILISVKCYQPKSKAEADNTNQDLDYF